MFTNFIMIFWSKRGEDKEVYEKFSNLNSWHKAEVNKEAKQVFMATIYTVVFCVLTNMYIAGFEDSLNLIGAYYNSVTQGEESYNKYQKEICELNYRMFDICYDRSGIITRDPKSVSWGKMLSKLIFFATIASPFIPFYVVGWFIRKSIKRHSQEQERSNIEERKRQEHKEQQERERQAEQRRAIAIREDQERRAYQAKLQEIEDVAYAKTKGQSRALRSLYEDQLKLLHEHKRRGLDIDREKMELERKMRTDERLEDNEMYDDLLQKLRNL